jgi:hypothetical protein
VAHCRQLLLRLDHDSGHQLSLGVPQKFASLIFDVDILHTTESAKNSHKIESALRHIDLVIVITQILSWLEIVEPEEADDTLLDSMTKSQESEDLAPLLLFAYVTTTAILQRQEETAADVEDGSTYFAKVLSSNSSEEPETAPRVIENKCIVGVEDLGAEGPGEFVDSKKSEVDIF